MKKFLQLPFKSAEVPQSLDQRILAAAALRACRFRRIRNGIRFALPAAAAAAALVTGITYFSFDTAKPQISQTDALTATEMLALADMTALEQSNYALASMSEMDFSEENLFI